MFELTYDRAEATPVLNLQLPRAVNLCAPAGVVERCEQASLPVMDLANAIAQRQPMSRDPSERRERSGPEGNHNTRVDKFDGRSKVCGAVRDLARRRRSIAPEEVEGQAENGIRDEDFPARETGLGEEELEAASRFVTAERNAGARRTVASGRFADEEDVARDVAVAGREDSRARCD